MLSDIREILESPLPQGQVEQIAYQLTTTPWGSSPTGVSVSLLEIDLVSGAETDVSAGHLTGPVTVAGDVITTPLVGSLIPLHNYRLEITFTVSGNTLDAFCLINGEY